MTQPIQLSVLLPAYNEAERLRVNLFEVLKTLDEASTEADAHPFELILVDDGSSDDTAGIARGVAQRDARVRVVSYKPNAGKGAALRRGFAAVTGFCRCHAPSRFTPPLPPGRVLWPWLQRSWLQLAMRGQISARLPQCCRPSI